MWMDAHVCFVNAWRYHSESHYFVLIKILRENGGEVNLIKIHCKHTCKGQNEHPSTSNMLIKIVKKKFYLKEFMQCFTLEDFTGEYLNKHWKQVSIPRERGGSDEPGLP
jgi:hypothetical protein